MTHEPGQRVTRDIFVAHTAKAFIDFARARVTGKEINLEELGFERIRARTRRSIKDPTTYRFSNGKRIVVTVEHDGHLLGLIGDDHERT